MKCSGVINAAAQGLTARSYHPHWMDVNPVKRQHLTNDEKAKLRYEMDKLRTEERQRQREIKRRWPQSVILYASK